jgi:hypothetical protein
MTRKRYTIVLLVVVAAIVAGALGFTQNSKSASAWVFTNVTPSQLASQGVTITPISTPPAVATPASVAEAAAVAFTGKPALVAPQYMHCVDTSATPAINQDCWVVSNSTAGEYAGGAALAATPAYKGNLGQQPILWDITFIDPASGRVVEGTLGN